MKLALARVGKRPVGCQAGALEKAACLFKTCSRGHQTGETCFVTTPGTGVQIRGWLGFFLPRDLGPYPKPLSVLQS